MPLKVHVLFSASVHVAIAVVPTLTQVTLRLKRDADVELGTAKTAPASVRRPRERRAKDIFDIDSIPSAVGNYPLFELERLIRSWSTNLQAQHINIVLLTSPPHVMADIEPIQVFSVCSVICLDVVIGDHSIQGILKLY